MSDFIFAVIMIALGMPYAYLIGRLAGAGWHDSKWEYHRRLLKKGALWLDQDDNDNNVKREEGHGRTLSEPQQWTGSRRPA